MYLCTLFYEMMNFLDQLNSVQRAAAECTEGPSLIVAAAGSGKTRVLTYKIAYVMQQGVPASAIMALTFTNKAAREMKERIQKLVGTDARYLMMGTFHSVCCKLLRPEADKLGYTKDFTIYDTSDSRSLLKAICKERGLDDKIYKPAAVLARISMLKNNLISPDEYGKNQQLLRQDREARMYELYDVYRLYQLRLKASNAMDFDDILLEMLRLMQLFPEVRDKYQQAFRYIFVDEYQDTNYVQYLLVKVLAAPQNNITVVGDDAQSIYSFRGADIRNILTFQQTYSGAHLFKLERNYRSTQNIVNAANSLIHKNEHQIFKQVYSEKEEGQLLFLQPYMDDRAEAEGVVREIERMKFPYDEIAVLYRTNAQSRSFEEQMRKDGIPYRIYGGLSFYQRKEIKDVIAYFRLVANPDDEEALRRIINYPARGIGDTTVGKIVETANLHRVSLWTVIQQPMVFDLKLARGTQTKIDAFKSMIEGWAAEMANEDAYVLGHSIIMQSGISKDIYSSNNPEDLSRQENLEEFLGGMQDFVESRREEGREDEVLLTDFLQEVALLTDLDSDTDADQPKVSLMTIHAAKGLEFPTVFVVGLEENIFPSPMCIGSMRELEEERRLLYVAITRAEKHCILTCAQNRFRYGRMEFDTPSRFIKDFDPRLLRVEGGKADIVGKQSSSFGSSGSFGGPARSGISGYSGGMRRNVQNPRPVATQFVADAKPRLVPIRHEAPRPQSAIGNIGLQEGNVIEHQRFGIGTVVKVEGSGENTKATVEFKNAGIKQLLLKFAKYTIVK